MQGFELKSSTMAVNQFNLSMTNLPNVTVTTKAATLTTYTVNNVNQPFSSYHIGLIVFSVLVILSSCFAISMYWRHKTIRKNLSNVLLLSLAVSDLLIGLVYVPVLIVCERADFDENKWLDTLSRYHYVLGNFCGFSTVFHIIALTVDKYIAVLYPFKKMHLSSRLFYRKILIFLWIIALFFALIPLCWIFKDERTVSWYRKQHIYGIVQLVIFFGLSLVILIFCYYRMFVKIHQKRREATLTATFRRREGRERKTAVVFLCFFAVFVIGWFPWFLFSLNNDLLRVPIEIKDFLITLRYAGSFLNPLIYAFLKNDYRQAINSDLVKLCSRSPAKMELCQLKNTSRTANESKECQDRHGSSDRSIYDNVSLTRRP